MRFSPFVFLLCVGVLGCGTGTEPAGTESQRGKEFAEVEVIIDEEGKIEIDEEAWKTAIAAAVDRMETGIANLDADIADAVTIRPDPDDADAYSKRGMAYLAQGKFDEAIADLTGVIRIKPDYASAYFGRGAAYRSQRKYDEAIADFTEVIRIKPDLAGAYDNRGDTYLQQGKYDEAIADFTEIIRLASDNAGAYSAGAYYSRGVAYEKQGNKAKADADFAKAESLE